MEKYINNNLPLVSVAMCTYNGEKYLKEQLDSIINQKYKNIEIIITDDCSNDNTISIIKQYQKKHKQIKLYKNQKNLGFIKNFEKAISLCQGDYIALADQDDIWKKDKIKNFVKDISNNILIYSDAIIINEEGEEQNHFLVSPKKNLIKGNNNKAFLFNNCISGNTLMFKKELIPHILPIPDKVSFHDIWIAFVASTYGKITYTDRSFTLYRRYSEQITSKRKNDYKNFLQRLKEKEKIKLKDIKISLNNLEAYLTVKALDNKTKHIINRIIKHYKNFHNCFYDKELKQLLLKYKDEIFEMIPKYKRKKLAKKLSKGLWYHRLVLFS